MAFTGISNETPAETKRHTLWGFQAGEFLDAVAGKLFRKGDDAAVRTPGRFQPETRSRDQDRSTQRRAPGHAGGNRVDVLDSFRALAIIAVIGFHLLYLGERGTNSVRPEVGQPFDAVLSYGWLGVEFFFIISGFVIFMTLEASKSWTDFAWRRFVRIWPGYMLSAVVIFAAMYALSFTPYQRGMYDLLVSPFLWAPALNGEYISGVYWSLLVEVRFYVLVALLYFGLGAANFRWAWLAVTIGATALETLSPSVAIHLFSAKYLPFFTWGIVFYRLWRGGGDRLDLALFLTALASFGWMWSDRELAIHLIVLGMLGIFSLFVMGKLQFLAHPVLLFFGRISFALYLLHFEISIAVMSVLEDAGVPVVAAAFPAIAIVVGLATLQTFYFEEPAKDWLKKARFRIWTGSTSRPVPA